MVGTQNTSLIYVRFWRRGNAARTSIAEGGEKGKRR